MPHLRQEYRTKSRRIGVLDVLLCLAIVSVILYISISTS